MIRSALLGNRADSGEMRRTSPQGGIILGRTAPHPMTTLNSEFVLNDLTATLH